ncbi:MAG: hypothetical protein N4P95_01720, partial [Candidatus Lightella neohaematopini]|nr:hypothetical protein [Candidatus Lightella neohaematopini]
MKILKFGGSSLIHINNNILHVIKIIVKNAKIEKLGIVLSAPYKVTDNLILLVNSLNNRALVNYYLIEVKIIFRKIIESILSNITSINFDYLYLVLDNEFNSLNVMIIKLIVSNSFKECDIVKIVSWGERLIVLIIDKVIKSYGFHVTVIDPTKKILANGSYLESIVDINTSMKNINNT